MSKKSRKQIQKELLCRLINYTNYNEKELHPKNELHFLKHDFFPSSFLKRIFFKDTSPRMKEIKLLLKHNPKQENKVWFEPIKTKMRVQGKIELFELQKEGWVTKDFIEREPHIYPIRSKKSRYRYLNDPFIEKGKIRYVVKKPWDDKAREYKEDVYRVTRDKQKLAMVREILAPETDFHYTDFDSQSKIKEYLSLLNDFMLCPEKFECKDEDDKDVNVFFISELLIFLEELKKKIKSGQNYKRYELEIKREIKEKIKLGFELG